MAIAYAADKVFAGTACRQAAIIVVEDGIIKAVLNENELSPDIPLTRFPGCFIAPAFIDIQIYGAYNKLFAVYTNEDALEKLYEYNLKGGTNYFLPTVATNSYQTLFDSIDAIKNYWSKGGKGVVGLHAEGPWINKIRRGAHVESLIHSPTVEQAKHLLEYGKGVIKMITLAPEVCSDEVIELIQNYGVVISAGHSNATYIQAAKAFDKGISVATHLFNAMPPLHHRQPGLIGAILDNEKVMGSIIPDGHHVDFSIVKMAKTLLKDRLFIITDAVTETDKGYYKHQKEGDKYVCAGTLSGSALTIMKGVKNCVEQVGIELDEALRMASLYPAKVLGIDNSLGKIEIGYRADLVVFTESFDVVTSITA